MPERTFTHPLFGPVSFRTKSPTWVRGDQITFLSGFDIADITFATIPQLAKIPGTNNGKLRFHKRAHPQVLTAFADIERLGLLHHIKTCAGSLNFRLKKPTSGALSKEPSNHAFGIAIDLNSDDGSLGDSVAPVAPVFEGLGFRWGKSFNDPMHFEVKTFIDHPKETVQDVAVSVNGSAADLGAKNLSGGLVADIAKVKKMPGVTVVKESETKVRIKGPGGERTLPVQRFGDLGFVPLPLLAGIASFFMTFDNGSKSVTLHDIG